LTPVVSRVLWLRFWRQWFEAEGKDEQVDSQTEKRNRKAGIERWREDR
jgi:hypothetical protein